MLKKTVSVLMILCVLCFCLLPAVAQEANDVIAVKLNSNIAGLTEKEYEKFIELESDNVVYKTERGEPVSVSDYAGTPVFGKLVAGRTYDVSYSLMPADGFVLPEALTDENLLIQSGKGVSVFAKQIVSADYRLEDDSMLHVESIRIQARVVADGSVLQRVIGWFHDLFLKIRAWSLY